MAEAKPPTQHRRTTTKMLLDAYYSTPSPAATATTAAATTTTTTEEDELDREDFDADGWTRRVLEKATLRQLLHRERALQAEVRTLDGAMKTLVYENYTSFISATETIRRMKENVAAMEADMRALGATLGDAAAAAERADARVAPSRERLRRLAAVERLLRRLQFAVDLPARLRKCVELGAFAEAVRYHRATAQLIARHAALPSFARIRDECAATVDGLRATLRARLSVRAPLQPQQPQSPSPAADPTAGFPFREVGEAAALLLQLGEPEEELRGAFLASHGVAFDALFAHVESPALGAEPLAECARLAGAMFLVLLLRTFEAYNTAFLGGVLVDDELRPEGPAWADIIRFLDDRLERFLRLIQHRITERVSRRASASAPPAAAAAADQEEGADKKTTTTTKKDEAPSVADVLLCLEAVQAPIAQVGRQLPFLSTTERAGEILGSTLVRFVEAHFSALLDASADAVRRLEAECREHTLSPQQPKPDGFDAFWASVSAKAFQELHDSLDRVVSELQPLSIPVAPSTSPSLSSSAASGSAASAAGASSRLLASQNTRICNKVHIKTQQFFLHLENLFLGSIAINDNPNDKSAKAPFGPFLLALCGVSRRVASRIDRYAAKVGRSFPTDADVPLIQIEDLRRRFEELSAALLDSFVALEGGQLSGYMHKYITAANWLRSKEPRDVGLGASLFIDRVNEIDAYIAPFFEPDGVSPSGSSSGPGSVGGGSSSSMGSSLHPATPRRTASSPMFEKRPDAYGRVEFSRKAVLVSAVRIGLKAMFECVRLQTFGRSGFQQLQVDKYFLQASLLPLVGTVRDLQSLLDDIEANAQQRCIDPVPMDPTVTQHILRHRQLAVVVPPTSLSPPL